ncbi:hypothetical protein AALO_G00274100 [Alosa alosa]|uniref:Uncharacterized protein n=1 Tax=Alosa alosa TaxID=278164 RepID=A0AAV6FHS0_9TELE|nr:uncharacterized protein si:ch211-221j21.3 isoform X1 [Alosa sapidissima]XP_048089821.1 uncharacterized protein si:ch211-221j21.3 [Alosa alosa]KAG5262338.1 hypothetical protein AALO_G00274100 [Alosa alosa]
MSMEYITPLHNKRRHEEEHGNWECQPKRLCSGVVHCRNIEYGAVGESPMDTWEIQQQVLPNENRGNEVVPVMSTPQGRSSAQCCPRCMAGESGHINHIMGY